MPRYNYPNPKKYINRSDSRTRSRANCRASEGYDEGPILSAIADSMAGGAKVQVTARRNPDCPDLWIYGVLGADLGKFDNIEAYGSQATGFDNRHLRQAEEMRQTALADAILAERRQHTGQA